MEETLKAKDGQNTWWIAPVYSQAEIAYTRLKRFISDKGVFRHNDSKLCLTFLNGAVMWFKSGEKPDNLYGEDVIAAVYDEYTRGREESWFALRTTLTATRGKCKFIGNVKGTANWGWHLARKAEEGQKDWAYFKITAEDAVKAGILQEEEIEDARNTLPEGVFLELYYGIPNEQASNKFCYSFKEENHVGKCEVNYQYPVYLSFDFNYNPISVNVIQFYEGTIFVPHVIKLENSNIYQLCDKIRVMFPNAMWIVTGDLSGKGHSALVKDNLTYFKIIQEQLNISDSQIKIKGKNPNLEENQVLVNSILEHIPVQIDPDNASGLIFDCKFVQIDSEGKIIKTDRKDPTQQADSLDGFRYYLNKMHSDFVKIPKI